MGIIYRASRFETILTRLFVVFLALLVIVPIGIGYWPIELAKFYVAEAENSLDEAKDPKDSKHLESRSLLLKAVRADAEIEKSADYIKVLDRIEPIPTLQLISMLNGLSKSQRISVAGPHVAAAYKSRQFKSAYFLLAAVTPFNKTDSVSEKNFLAYLASLAERDLTLALQEINGAISQESYEVYQLLDTKAWILHGLHRDTEASPVIDRAIALCVAESEKLDLKVASITRDRLEIWLRAPNVDKPDEAIPQIKEIKDQSIAQFMKTLAVLTYHRAEILTSLKQTKEADETFEWLERRGFSDFKLLY